MENQIPKKIEYQQALVYCRVSSDRQVNEGHGLDSQAQRCLKRAEQLGFLPEKIKVFREEGVSGGLFDRPAMRNLIAYMDKSKGMKFVVIFDDLKRFSRDITVHLMLKAELVTKRKAKLECLNFDFNDSPMGIAVETIMVATGQLEKDLNKQQVIDKMRARLDAGFYPFCPPPGYTHIKGELTAVEPLATIYKMAIEKYRDYELNTLEQVADFINSQYHIQGIRKKPVSLNGADRILRNPIYAGYVVSKKWETTLIPGKHAGIISVETFQAVLDKLEGKEKPRHRQDYSEDFRLRGYLLCDRCGRLQTGSWHTGKDKKYPHYWCKSKYCERYSKANPRDKAEQEFGELLGTYAPVPEILNAVEITIQDIWSNRQELEENAKAGIIKQLRMLEEEIDNLSTQMRRTKLPSVYERQETDMDGLLKKKASLEAELHKTVFHQQELGTATAKVFGYIKDPVKAWKTNIYEEQRLLLHLYFERGIPYFRETGFGTPELPLIIKLTSQKYASKNHMVEMARVKLASKTFSSSHCSQD